MNFIKKIIEMIIAFLKEAAKKPPTPEMIREDVIRVNPGLFAGTDWRDFRYIVIHHSLTKDQQVVDWDAIWRYHVEEKGWSDIGYNSGVEIVKHQLRVMIGRPLNMDGAHALGFNDISIGICVIGSYDYSAPNKVRLTFLADLVKKYMRVFNIPKENVIGHRDVYALLGIYPPKKTCPGSLFSMVKLRELL